jgi:dephospho-CoA kinase
METAILFESRANERVDKTITVYSPAEMRISRVMKRDSCSRDDVLLRMQHQIQDEEKIKLADFVLYNDDNHMLIPQVLDLHKQFSSNKI